jgi:hypothetical protein
MRFLPELNNGVDAGSRSRQRTRPINLHYATAATRLRKQAVFAASIRVIWRAGLQTDDRNQVKISS